MGTGDPVGQRLLLTFAAEARERLQSITEAVGALGGASGEALAAIRERVRREVHSLKGAARAVGRTDAETVCQSLEGLLGEWNEGTAETQAAAGRALGAVEALRTLLALREAAPPPSPAAPREDIVRVPLGELDSLARHAEEMVAVKLAAEQTAEDVRALAASIEAWRKRWTAMLPELQEARPSARDALARQEEQARALRAQVTLLSRRAGGEAIASARRVDALLRESRRALLVPFSTVLEAMPQMVRDIGTQLGKEARLVLRAGEIRIDRRVLGVVRDPMTLLVRNALDHGLEAPQERLRAGKRREGTITISVARTERDVVEVAVSDDGAGFSLEGLREAAIERGEVSKVDAPQLQEAQILELAFRSGVSTAKSVSTISGRGLGLAIVRERVEAIGGEAVIETQRGAGTTVRLLLPVTCATFRGVQVRVAGRSLVIPTMAVERVGRVKRDEIRVVDGRPTVSITNRALSFIRLADSLGIPDDGSGQGDPVQFAVLEAGGTRMACSVDEVVREQEVVLRSLGPKLASLPGTSGAAILGTGEVVPVLSVSDVLACAQGLAATGAAAAATGAPVASGRQAAARVLLVEDSITSRLLLEGILGSAGHLVSTAVDGLDGLEKLARGGFDLVVSDVEMPGMDGFELTRRLRGDPRFSGLPVVLVTGRQSVEDRARGMEAGANAYITKAGFDQDDLLDAIQDLL